MTFELVIIGLLVLIVLMLAPPEVSFYFMFAALGILLVISIVALGIAFVNDPIGCLYSIATENPFMSTAKEMMNTIMQVAQNVSIVRP